jgi:hypothetical protein
MCSFEKPKVILVWCPCAEVLHGETLPKRHEMWCGGKLFCDLEMDLNKSLRKPSNLMLKICSSLLELVVPLKKLLAGWNHELWHKMLTSYNWVLPGGILCSERHWRVQEFLWPPQKPATTAWGDIGGKPCVNPPHNLQGVSLQFACIQTMEATNKN